jgi:hypothetical protein
MQAVEKAIKKFAQLDLNQDKIAFQSWVEKKDTTIDKLKSHLEFVEKQSITNTYEQWLLMKSIQLKRLQLDQEREKEQKKEQEKLQAELHEMKRVKRQESYLLWIETKKIQKIQQELLSLEKVALSMEPKPTLKQQNSKSKRVQVVRAKHPKDWVSIIAHVDGAELERTDGSGVVEMKHRELTKRKKKLILSPPLLFQEQERITNTNFKKKYHNHVANGF